MVPLKGRYSFEIYSWIMLPLSLLIVTNGQNSQKFQTSLYKILRNYLCDAKGLETRFHFSGHTIGFHLQTQQLELQTK